MAWPRQQGLALGVGLFLLLLLTLLSMAAVRLSLFELRLALNDELHADATERAASLVAMILRESQNTSGLAVGSVRCLAPSDLGAPCSEGERLVLRDRTAESASAFVTRLPPTAVPPPVSSAFSADRFHAQRLRVVGRHDRSEEGFGAAQVNEDLMQVVRRPSYEVVP